MAINSEINSSTTATLSTIQFVLRDINKAPLKNLPYEIKDNSDGLVQSGRTDSEGQLSLTHEAGAQLFLYLQPLTKGEMKQYHEFTMHNFNGSVIWTTNFLVVKATLQQEGASGDYVRGTYVVQKGDSLASITKRFNLDRETFLALNEKILNGYRIFVGQVLKLPDQKKRHNPKL